MFDPVRVRQAYVIQTTLGFIPDIATNPDALKPEWQGLSAFSQAGWPEAGQHLLRLGQVTGGRWPSLRWRSPKLSLPADLQPKRLDTSGWRFSWLPTLSLPPHTNPSTALYVYIYPFGIVSIKLATTIGFRDGIEVTDFIHLLRRLASKKTEGKAWLRVTSPWPGVEVNFDSLAERILAQLQKNIFAEVDSGQVVRGEAEGVADHLSKYNGLVTDLVRTEPQAFNREQHAAAFRGLVTLRPRWNDINDPAKHLAKYQQAQSWTDFPQTWHYAGGLNTVLWHARLPEGRERQYRRNFTWLVAHVAELARLEKVIYDYSRDFVVKAGHDELLQLDQARARTLLPANWPRQKRLTEWTRLWLKVAGLPEAQLTPDAKQIYTVHAAQLGTHEARQKFTESLQEYKQALSAYKTLGQDVLEGVDKVGKVIDVLTKVTRLKG